MILMGFYLPKLFKRMNSPLQESLLSQISPMLIPSAVQVNNAWRFLYSFERHSVPSWKQQPNFIFVHNSQEYKCKLKSGCRHCCESKVSSMRRFGAQPQFTHSINKQLFCLLCMTLGKQFSLSVPLFPCL